MVQNIVTKTDGTKSGYLYRASNLIKRFEREVGAFDIVKGEFVSWLVSQKPKWRGATWRYNKSAIMHFFEVKGFEGLRRVLFDIGSEGCYVAQKGVAKNSVKHKTSSSKKKSVSAEEERRLVGYFEHRKGCHWSLRTIMFFRASIISGLRPSEWTGTEYIEEFVMDDGSVVGPVLKVRNAKDTNERAHGEYRHLILSDLSDEHIRIIKGHMQLVKASMGPSGVKIPFESYYHACRNALYRANTTIWRSDKKKKPTLYSGRHQFAANLKAAGYSRAEVAALMGHAVDDTASEHYGRKTSGRTGGGLPKALPSEVERVREVYDVSQTSQMKPK